MGTVATRNLKKSFGALDVIKDININIEHGEFAVLVGPSGCGKSTLLRIIAGLDDASAGEIAIGGRNVTNLPPKERDIAMVFQNYALYPHMSVAENMGFSLFLAGKPKAEIEEEVNRAADILGLTPLLSRKPSQLSGGQRQRVAMGRAIVRKPSVFLFDEPLSNLDAKLRVKMRGEIKAMHQKLGPTVIYVTHDQIEAMTMADKIIVVDGGRISQIGAPLDLYDNPTNVFVATFIGSPAMNILPAVVEGDRGLRLRDGQVVAFPHAANPGDKVQIGIRPEHLGISSPENGISAEVRMVEPTGSETHITAEVAGSEIVAVVRDRVKVAVGDRIGLQAHQPGRYYLFREDNGLVINHVMA